MEKQAPIFMTPTDDFLRSLGHSFLFSALTDGEKERAIAMGRVKMRVFRDGEPLISAGEPFPYLGFLAKGEATVSRSGERHTVVLNRLKAGDIFGGSALFGKDTLFKTNILAKGDVVLLLIGQREVEKILEAFPPAAMAYITYLSEKIRFLNRRLDVLAGRSTEEKLAVFLLEQSGGSQALRFSKTVLAKSLGLGRASLYRVLDSFAERGIIRLDGSSIIVLLPEELKKILNNK